jgi:glycosyltransferase involved in cell wall biosynthesis
MTLSKEISFAFYENQQNLGIPGTCNRGLNFATGEYFIVLGDDLLLSNRISGDVKILKDNSDIGLVCGMAKVIGPDGMEIEEYAEWSNRQPEGAFQESPEAVWLRGSRIFTPTVTYRTQTLRDSGGWDMRYDFEDRPMFIRLAQNGVRGWHRAEVTTLYRRHEKNYSARLRVGMLRQELDLITNFELSIPTWKVKTKLLIEIHYWMLFMNATAREAHQALSLAGLDRWIWTLRSRPLKFAFLGLTYLRSSRIATRDSKRYLQSGEDMEP